mgnify:CR=1 FL=1
MDVIHDVNQHRFQISQPEGEAVLDYVPTGSHQITFTHTFVPPALRGRGLAEALVKAGLGWAQQQSLDVKATCSYVLRYLERHPQPARPYASPACSMPEIED